MILLSCRGSARLLRPWALRPAGSGPRLGGGGRQLRPLLSSARMRPGLPSALAGLVLRPHTPHRGALRGPPAGGRGQKSTRSGQWKSLPLTRSSAHGRLSLLVTQHGRVVPPEPNMVVPGTPPASPAGSRLQNPKGSSSSGCVTSRGNCCFYQELVQAPRLGGAPGRGRVHSRGVATVPRWQQPGRANGEDWAPHAENGLGDNDTPGSQPGSGAAVSGQS